MHPVVVTTKLSVLRLVRNRTRDTENVIRSSLTPNVQIYQQTVYTAAIFRLALRTNVMADSFHSGKACLPVKSTAFVAISIPAASETASIMTPSPSASETRCARARNSTRSKGRVAAARPSRCKSSARSLVSFVFWSLLLDLLTWRKTE